MKMVSAAKFAKAERELKPARVYGAGATGVYAVFKYLLYAFSISSTDCLRVVCSNNFV